MEEKEELCSECKSNTWKYKCPCCFIRTCSLPCVKSHKAKTGCTGKRSLTHVVPLSKFDDNILLADYNMLEDVKRVAESAKRMRQEICGYTHFKLPERLKNLQRAANSRRTKILFLSNGMSKREKNKTYYNNRKKFISWTIEWRFHLTDTALIDHGVHENTSLQSVIENHLKPSPWNHPLRQFSEEPLDSLKFFIQKGTKSSFCELDIKVPLRQQLTNKVILEYPVIYVFLPSHSCNFEVIRDSVPLKAEQNETVCDSPSPKGMMFKEEDIEDGGSLDPHVSDLLNVASSNKEETNNLDQDICDDLDLVYSYMKENDLWLKEDCGYLSDVLAVDEEPEEGEIEFKSSTEEMESNKSVLTTSQAARSFVSGRLDVDDKDICDDTNLFPSSMKEKVLGEKEDCTYLSEVLHVDEELEEGEIA
ncbi:putative box C/D snoRNA protein SPCC613.07 [Lycium ferocissimum]|uniref:putative box C/D snoRNA protein SPCC613.07 n=1 Tax=Lycium ferocissimum TaxID=112874 RepID=UPI0028157621|nr:putative box C/D snoRNA protein SPCC613.07 [Lycium ferocissimum]